MSPFPETGFHVFVVDSMAGEHSESEAHGGDQGDAGGVNGSSVATTFADTTSAARAAFIAGELGDDADAKADAKADKSKADARDKTDLEDEDADLAEGDDDDQDEDTDVEAKADDEEDPDKDLDEDDDKPADKGDAETAKRLEQVRKTDKRLREQREAQFKAREQELKDIEANLESRWKPRIEAAEEFERLKSRKHDPIGVLKALGYSGNADFADIARLAWGETDDVAKDPKNKAAIDRMKKDRELSDEIANLKREREEEKKASQQREREAEGQRNVEVFVGKVTKAVSDKMPLAKKFIETDPDNARVEIEVIGGRMAQQLGRLPDPKAVMVEFEKQERRRLRRYGIDPKTMKPGTPAAAAPAVEVRKAADKKKPAAPTIETKSKPLTKQDFIDGKFD